MNTRENNSLLRFTHCYEWSEGSDEHKSLLRKARALKGVKKIRANDKERQPARL